MKTMDKGKLAIIILVIALIVAGGYIVYKNYPNLLNISGSNAKETSGNTYVTYQTSPQASQQQSAGTDNINYPSQISYVHAGEVYATPSAIKEMDLYVEPVDWDSVVGNDGIVIHFNFYDEQGRKVIFSGSSIDCVVNVYTPTTDRLMRSVNPRKVLYKGYATITNSDQGEGGPLAGIRIAYSDLSLGEYDRGIGQIKITASLPSGGTVEAEETYIYTRK